MTFNFHHITLSPYKKLTRSTLYIFLLIIMNIGCSDNNQSSSSEETSSTNSESNSNTKNYEDGTYCAEVTYYNPNTGTRSTYTLNVEVEGNELTQINWPNGGWLDDSHFSPEELDEDGNCSFTSDRGYEYEVKITGSPCFSTDERKARFDRDDRTCPKCGEEKSSFEKYCDDCLEEICPKCGRKKYSWDKYCTKCIDLEENTCSRCGSYEFYVNGGLCSDCKRQDEEEEEERRRQDEDN